LRLPKVPLHASFILSGTRFLLSLGQAHATDRISRQVTLTFSFGYHKVGITFTSQSPGGTITAEPEWWIFNADDTHHHGWRFFFYANERNEPVHIHCQKGEAEAKYWLDADGFEAFEGHAYNMSPADKRVVRRIIFEHFDYIVSEWTKWQERRDG
jgi:hypothetical protein